MATLATHSVGAQPALTHRAAASSVAPIGVTIGAPCVLASLGDRDPGIQLADREGR